MKIIGKDNINNPAQFDGYSLLHLSFGFISYIILKKYLKISIINSFILFNIIHFMYELKDYYFTYIKKYNGNHPITTADFSKIGYHANNSYINSLGDLIIGCVGFYIAYKYV